MTNTRHKSPRTEAGCRTPLRIGWMLCAGLVLVGLQSGCSGSTSTQVNSASDAKTRRDEKIVHQECDINSNDAQKIDANGDGRPDITIVKSGGHEVCRAVDLDFDGKIDAWVYRDPSGQVTRRETDYDRDGRIDEISKYKNGVLVEKDRATTLGGKLDTWEYYKNGKLASAERDSDGDGVVDQWWEYPASGKPGCPIIHSDIDGDGHPDPGSSVDVCKDAGYVPPERMPEHQVKSPDFKGPGAVPTELSNKPADSSNTSGTNGDQKGSDQKGGK